MTDDVFYLYGGDRPWDARDWAASDDRVRGGASWSHLSVDEGPAATARFHGRLDVRTLGGAGFASQRTRGALGLALSGFDGLVVDVAAADGRRYALTLKDGAAAPPPGAASLSWEAVFVADGPRRVRLAWADFAPTYRGRPAPRAEPLKLDHIQRVGLMMRSFFGEQEGDFSLELRSIAAWRSSRPALPAAAAAGRDDADDKDAEGDEQDEDEEEDLKAGLEAPRRSRWRRLLLCGLRG